jgi:Na+-driven multidrug efflux pump
MSSKLAASDLIHPSVVSRGRILAIWLPLALTWAMMAIEGPVLNAIVSRLPDQAVNLAAFGLSVSIAIVIESPVIMLLSTSIALVRDFPSWLAVRRYGVRLCVITTAVMVVAVLPPVHSFVSHDVLHLPPAIADKLQAGLMCLVLWPASIGYRRLYQGVMIANGSSRLVAVASITRVATMSLISISLATFTSLTGIIIGSLSLSLGVFFEAIATRFMARDVIESLKQRTVGKELTHSEISAFYRPLAWTSVAAMAINPLSSFFMARFPYPTESMAVFPVVDSLVFQFKSSSYALQETVVSLAGGSRADNAALRRFAMLMMICTSGLLGALAFSPLLIPVYTVFPFTLSAELASFAITPTYIFIVLPAVQVWNSYLKGLMINQRRTQVVSASTFLEVGCLVVFALMFLLFSDVNGVNATFLAFLFGRIISSLYLLYHSADTRSLLDPSM